MNQLPSIRNFYAGKVFPAEQVAGCRNTEQYFPTRLIKNGNSPLVLSKSTHTIDNISFKSNSEEIDLFDYVSRNRIAGLMVVKNSQVVFENYEYGNRPDTRWMSMSMAKSISASLVGAAIKDGYIDSLDDYLTKYIPRLCGGSYADVTVRQLLLMSSGVHWNEDHTDPTSNRTDVLNLQISQQPGSILDYVSKLPKVAEAGTRWNYSTGETHVVGELLKAATNKWLAEYLAEKIWIPQGMESDASWWLESKDGLEIAGSGINATLSDYARFGLFIQNRGIINGIEVLPSNWISMASGPTKIASKTEPYGYMWWTVPDPQGEYSTGAFSARGIFGQRIYVNPVTKLVVVILAARSKPLGDQGVIDNDFFNAVDSLLITN